jgi:hypothetical protein
MKKVIILLTLSILSSSSCFAQDEILHISGTAVISSIIHVSLEQTRLTPIQRALVTLGVTLTLGLAKELTDETISGKDMAANTVGSMIGIGITWMW